MCKYCEEVGFTPLSDTVEYSGLEISMNKKGWIRCRAYMGKEIFETQDVVSINYCPICGKKLEVN